LSVGWVAASIALLVLFPHPETFGSASTGTDAIDVAPAPPLETLTPEQISEWDKFLGSLVPLTDAALLPTGTAKVLFIKFNDYQCPSCRQTWSMYHDIFEKYEKEYPGVFVFQTRDLPLEPECGLQLNHMMACEAAVAVRLAREKNKGPEMEAWLFNHQSFEMTRDELKKGLREVTQISNFDEQYPKVLPTIREDVQLAKKLGVTGTPTFFVNGVKIANLRTAYLDATIQYFLKKTGATS
jgi:protein-disulfide isomerase